ncbi:MULTISPECIES: bifunctional 4-hydroxy-2-oxoglutarate aldolase/2-dehydro-3-deoxy-phosphogluconate aldolase [Geobacillus]|jgi:2-dehydro-3-deoxyphosphogluconate aldolase / (4S)-4-hydroxy-2-oxoglutarate aldolase|uniref:bifunctional 4-hydroxy-2-oxoglutarate aldolase/2-dehydro-3-deoxy-phosphogluconate aldolase n=1 Tax=Geobacillus TaxID=129337 RepID=UPI0004060661|nr:MULTISPECIES: bifunctional 4-hydroxy-2-oxoglutarate aldolase/2-dehydro-3-deoxy-phosphogluconate aldolase [Geobacillus]ARA99558.1 2-dehydro-3-deoxyphosphogluconate aldolase [Geobacillus thermodenitrificans]KQB93149.1 2-dehydro-3-deoxyphosphogluconate aldolase [Geobacillus sp. PA-3]MED3717258.1 bifunctional 4-hydroxy-2-oxoglutarate aldolase/2-dehydro-3-deoxy-phosphogluconate aldolase [Geobacillus thermodenitrificans]
MDKIFHLNRLKTVKLVAVIRKPKRSQIFQIAEALIAGGVEVLEVTVDTPGSFEMIAALKEAFGAKATIGAGTVLDAETAKRAIEAGSDFIFSPIFDQETISLTNRYGKISIPGVMTPTEIVKAYQMGADLLKVFPAGSLGPQYFKELRGPLGHIPLMPTGGVTLENAAEFIRNGAAAIGVGSALLDKRVIEEGRFNLLTETAKRFVETVRNAAVREVE